MNCYCTFASSLTGCLFNYFIQNYSLRGLSTVSSVPKSSIHRKQGLQMRFKYSTSDVIDQINLHIYLKTTAKCLLMKLPYNKQDFSLSPVIYFSF